MFEDEGRCGDCDSRFCEDVCLAFVPGYVYATGRGYVTFEQAAEIESQWTAGGFDHGIDHGIRRVDWDRAVPHPNETVDIVRVAALNREHNAGRYGVTEMAMLYGFKECV